ncbi:PECTINESTERASE INHIBITOR-LIKE [Salix purpurea]|uniref:PECTINESTERASE INHIBITOR-LIKE n=1 Tax=Salix purpurea TaxID=77065 RepID=A0A9Q1A1N0_SALPP|nr:PECTINESTERASE INHIBITOR-LIKE [Salix purpurea]
MARILQEAVFPLTAHQRADTDITAIELAVKLWVDEKRYYDYESNSCVRGEVCDHKFSERGTMDAAAEAKSCGKEFTARCKSPLSDMNGAVHDVSIVAASIVKTMMITF